MNLDMVAEMKNQKQDSTLPVMGAFRYGCRECPRRKEALQRAAVNSGPDDVPPIVHEVLRSPGKPLDRETQDSMETRFGYDFSRIRVHTNIKAAESAQNMNSKAYTMGKNIVFDSDRNPPNSYEGMRILEHELTHVILERGNENSINFWGGADHEAITSSAARDITGDELFAFQLSKYSSLMDFRTRRLLLTGPAFLIGFIKGEGPEHGEDGNYTNPNEGSAASQNIGLQESYLRMAIKFDEEAESLRKRKEPVHRVGSAMEKAFAALGDACHIAQDRGSHGEGVKGKGHNDPRTKSGWDPDNRSDNDKGYARAILNTRQLLNKWKTRRSVIPE